jgi:hypothetical protein
MCLVNTCTVSGLKGSVSRNDTLCYISLQAGTKYLSLYCGILGADLNLGFHVSNQLKKDPTEN